MTMFSRFLGRTIRTFYRRLPFRRHRTLGPLYSSYILPVEQDYIDGLIQPIIVDRCLVRSSIADVCGTDTKYGTKIASSEQPILHVAEIIHRDLLFPRTIKEFQLPIFHNQATTEIVERYSSYDNQNVKYVHGSCASTTEMSKHGVSVLMPVAVLHAAKELRCAVTRTKSPEAAIIPAGEYLADIREPEIPNSSYQNGADIYALRVRDIDAKMATGSLTVDGLYLAVTHFACPESVLTTDGIIVTDIHEIDFVETQDKLPLKHALLTYQPLISQVDVRKHGMGDAVKSNSICSIIRGGFSGDYALDSIAKETDSCEKAKQAITTAGGDQPPSTPTDRHLAHSLVDPKSRRRRSRRRILCLPRNLFCCCLSSCRSLNDE